MKKIFLLLSICYFSVMLSFARNPQLEDNESKVQQTKKNHKEAHNALLREAQRKNNTPLDVYSTFVNLREPMPSEYNMITLIRTEPDPFFCTYEGNYRTLPLYYLGLKSFDVVEQFLTDEWYYQLTNKISNYKLPVLGICEYSSYSNSYSNLRIYHRGGSILKIEITFVSPDFLNEFINNNKKYLIQSTKGKYHIPQHESKDVFVELHNNNVIIYPKVNKDENKALLLKYFLTSEPAICFKRKDLIRKNLEAIGFKKESITTVKGNVIDTDESTYKKLTFNKSGTKLNIFFLDPSMLSEFYDSRDRIPEEYRSPLYGNDIAAIEIEFSNFDDLKNFLRVNHMSEIIEDEFHLFQFCRCLPIIMSSEPGSEMMGDESISAELKEDNKILFIIESGV